MSSNVNFDTIRRASEDQKLRHHEFRSQLRDLEFFENNISHVNKTFADITAKYDGDYALDIKDLGTFQMTDTVVTDVMQKTGADFEGSKRAFDVIKDVPNLSNVESPIGFDYFYQTLEKSKRDVRNFSEIEHRLLFYDGKIVGLKNHDFPYYTFKHSEFFPAFLDEAEKRGKTIEKPVLDFDVNTGRIFGELLFDTINIRNASVNDTVGIGLRVTDGKLGGTTFRFQATRRVLACGNGIIGSVPLLNIQIRHTSEANFANKFAESLKGFYGEKYYDSNSLDNVERGIIGWMDTKNQMPAHPDPLKQKEYSEAFYSLLARTVFEVIDARKEQEIIMFETAAADNIEDFTQALDRTWRRFRLPQRDQEIAEEVFEADSLINSKNPTRYDLSNVLSRMANSPTFNDEKVDMYQEAAYEILSNPQILN